MTVYMLKKKCGNFVGPPDAKGNRTTYKSGDRVSSDEDLVTKWPGKFGLVGAYDEGPVSDAPEIPTPSDKKAKKDAKGKVTKTKTSKIEPPAEGKHGIDVTKDFPTAATVELQVFEKSKWFTVIDPDNGEVLNEKKLRGKHVEDFLKDYLPDNEDTNDEDDDEDEDDDDEE